MDQKSGGKIRSTDYLPRVNVPRRTLPTTLSRSSAPVNFQSLTVPSGRSILVLRFVPCCFFAGNTFSSVPVEQHGPASKTSCGSLYSSTFNDYACSPSPLEHPSYQTAVVIGRATECRLRAALALAARGDFDRFDEQSPFADLITINRFYLLASGGCAG